MLDLYGFGQKNKPVTSLGSKERNNPVSQRFTSNFLEGRVENEAILKLADNKHLWDDILKPFLQFFKHVIDVCINEPIELIRVKTEPGNRLQKTVGAAERTSTRRDQLPELETNNAGIFSGTGKSSNKARCSLAVFHRALPFSRNRIAISALPRICASLDL